MSGVWVYKGMPHKVVARLVFAVDLDASLRRSIEASEHSRPVRSGNQSTESALPV